MADKGQTDQTLCGLRLRNDKAQVIVRVEGEIEKGEIELTLYLADVVSSQPLIALDRTELKEMTAYNEPISLRAQDSDEGLEIGYSPADFARLSLKARKNQSFKADENKFSITAQLTLNPGEDESFRTPEQELNLEVEEPQLDWVVTD